MSCIELPQMAPPEYLHPKGVKSIVVLDVIIKRMYLNPKLGANTDFLK